MVALAALPWRTTCLGVTIFHRSIYHVGTSSKILSRNVHTESGESSSKESTSRPRSPPKKSSNGSFNKGLVRAWDSRQRMMSITIKQNAITPDDKFFDLLKKLRPDKSVWNAKWRSKNEPRLTLFILFTPGFAPWLADDTFIPKVLERISRPSEGRLVYDVIYACVDGIAPHLHHGSFHGQTATQGFSILQTRKRKAWSYSLPGKQPTLTFEFYNIPSRVRVPVANTLFYTGRPSEVAKSRWEAKDGTFVEIKERVRLAGLYFHDSSLTELPLFSFIPARPITPFRTVGAGVGNIVRTLDFGDGDIGPASKELETAVSAISESLGGVIVDVWALIVPPDVLSAESENMPEVGPEYVGFWLDRGARICRVVSGGGGWGPKQGLLSLDPDTEIDYQKTSEPDDGSADEETIFSLGNLAQAGASIQFLVIDENPPVLKNPSNNSKPLTFGKSMVFGTIPSTIDDLPQVDNPIPEKKPYSYRMQHFGCVSGSGIYYKHGLSETKPLPEPSEMISENPNPSESSEKEQPEVKPQSESAMVGTKITLPYSYLYFDSQKAPTQTKALEVLNKKWAKSGPSIRRLHAPLFVRRINSDRTDEEKLAMSERVQEDHIGQNIYPEENDESQDTSRPTDMFRDMFKDMVAKKAEELYQMSPREGGSARLSVDFSTEEDKEPKKVTIRKHFVKKAIQFVKSRELPEPLSFEEMTPRQRAFDQYARVLWTKKQEQQEQPQGGLKADASAGENQETKEESKVRKYLGPEEENKELPQYMRVRERIRIQASLNDPNDVNKEPRFRLRGHAFDPVKASSTTFEIRKHITDWNFDPEKARLEFLKLEDMSPRQRALEQKLRYLAKKEKQKAANELKIRKYDGNDKCRNGEKVLNFGPELQKEENLEASNGGVMSSDQVYTSRP